MSAPSVPTALPAMLNDKDVVAIIAAILWVDPANQEGAHITTLKEAVDQAYAIHTLAAERVRQGETADR